MHFKLAFRLRPGIAPFGLEIAVSEDVDIRGEAERGSLTGASMFVLHRIDALADKLREAISLITCGCGRPGAAQFPDGPPPCFRSASTATILEDERLCSCGCDLQPEAMQIGRESCRERVCQYV